MRFSAYLTGILSAFVISGSASHSQDRVEEAGYLTCPIAVPGGIVVSDNYGSGVYVAGSDGIRELVGANGAGKYWVVSPDRKSIGFKRVLDDGSQAPEIVEISTGAIRRLHAPVPLAGQVSFVADGSAAFMVGNELVVVSGAAQVRYEIGQYINIAPISPDGFRVAYADISGGVHIRELRTGADRVICPPGGGHGFPVWSPDGSKLLYSDLAGHAFVYDRFLSRTAVLGEAFAPSWSPDGSRIVFYRKEIVEGRLVNSDLYLCDPDGTGLTRITSTPDICEMDPAFDLDGTSVVCQTFDRRTIRSIAPATGAVNERARTATVPYHLFAEPVSLHKVALLDIPYVNQVYDTPDWFNGHAACGPTTASMLLAYYRALPPWPGWCSTPSGHVNEWGRYVSDRYRFRESDYVWQANDPNGRPAQGGYGYMWASGSPHSMMASYYLRHGISAATVDYPALQTAADEVGAGRPYSLCVDLTSAGHIVLAHAYEGNGTFVVNDPYGDKNKPGYPNPYGKNARYDWPGWNNGHVNFGRYVYWGVSGTFTRPAVTDTVVDDLQFDTGFTLYNQAPVSMLSWKDVKKGYNGHFWYAYTHADSVPDSCFATWTPNLSQAGAYEVFAYIPYSNATAARYQITTVSGQRTVEIDQKSYRDAWVSLGSFDLAAGGAGMVRLGDASSADRQELVFDAVKWSYRGAATEVVQTTRLEPAGFALVQNYPNPFNGTSNIGFRIAEYGFVRIAVYDVLGREVAVLVNEYRPAGLYAVRFEAGAMTSGTYIVKLSAGSFNQTRRMVLVK